MSRKNEDSIEKFFRKAVRQSDTTFRESDWLSMEKMLDEQTHAQAALRARAIRRVVTAASGVLLLSVALYFFLPEGGQDTVHGPQSTVHSQQPVVETPQATADSSPAFAGDQLRGAEQSTDESQQGEVHSPPTSAGDQLRRAKQSTVHGQQPAVDDAGQMDTQALQQGNRAEQVDREPSTEKAVADKDIKSVDNQRPTTQDTRVTEKPSQPERPNGSAAVSKTHVTPANTVAKTSGQPNRVSKPRETDRQNAANTKSSNNVTNKSAPDAQHNAAVAIKDDGSVKDQEPNKDQGNDNVQNTTPAATTTTTISTPETEPSSRADHPIEKDQTPIQTPSSNQSTLSPATAPTDTLTTPDKNVDRFARRSPDTIGAKVGGLSTDSTISTITADTVQTNSAAQEPLAEKKPTSETPEDDKPPIRSRWNVALVVAPDFSSTGVGSEMTSPGQAFGGLIGYRLSRKFTVTSGVFRTSKKYVGHGNDYQPPEGYWLRRTNGVVPNEIKGRCTIIEVPLIVQYDLRQGARSRLYVSGGVSSYFMRHEAYDYDFNEPNEGADRGWSSSAPSSFLFKVGHLSVAYELMLMQRLGVGIEPFIKVPFQGIGWANISLYTTGAYVNVRYYLTRKSLK